jgi:c-di-GMP-binding flagellar brake protein YcgR
MFGAPRMHMQSNSSNQAVRLSEMPPWERRNHPRFEISTEALLIDTDWHTQKCRCGDISRGGACVYSPRLLRPGRVVELWFALAGVGSIECEAEIVRRERDRMGMRFIGMDVHQLRELERFLERVQPLH